MTFHVLNCWVRRTALELKFQKKADEIHDVNIIDMWVVRRIQKYIEPICRARGPKSSSHSIYAIREWNPPDERSGLLVAFLGCKTRVRRRRSRNTRSTSSSTELRGREREREGGRWNTEESKMRRWEVISQMPYPCARFSKSHLGFTFWWRHWKSLNRVLCSDACLRSGLIDLK